MPDNNNTPEIEILPPEPGHKGGQQSGSQKDGFEGSPFAEEDPFQRMRAPAPWQILLLRIVRAILVIALLAAAFFFGTIILGVIAILVVAFALWAFWLRATGRGPGIHIRRF